MKIEFYIKNFDGDIYLKNNLDSYPIVIISHGFKGWKNWGFIPYIAEQISQKNALAITFNYSHNGKPNNTGFLTDIENFATNSISQEINDLNSLIEAVINNEINIPNNIFSNWNGSIYLLGHSLGAGISLIVGSNNNYIKKIIMLASIGIFDRYTSRQKQLWEKQGFIEFPNQTTEQMLELNLQFLKDLEKNKEKYNLKSIIDKITKPVLIIHGEQDFTVPMKEILPLINTQNSFVKSKIIKKTGHTFGIVHPFEYPSQELKEVLKKILQFLDLN